MKTKPKIITIGGLPGSGKTTLADALAAHMTKHGTKAVSIDSDRVRKELWGYEETARLPEEAYTWEATKHVIFETQN